MKKTKHSYRKRTFLNDDIEMSAFVIASVPAFKMDDEEGSVFCYPTLDISDCSNKISLDFSFYQESQMKKAHKKLKKFQSVVQEFTECFEKQMEEYLKNPPPPVKKKKRTRTILNDITSD